MYPLSFNFRNGYISVFASATHLPFPKALLFVLSRCFSSPESLVCTARMLSCSCVRAWEDNKRRAFSEMKFESFPSHFTLHSHEHLNDAFERSCSQLREGSNAVNIGKF
jgi:hypothetical protein